MTTARDTREIAGAIVLRYRSLAPEIAVELEERITEALDAIEVDLHIVRNVRDDLRAQLAIAQARVTELEETCKELEARVIRKAIWIVAQQPFYPDTKTGMRQQWVKDQIVAALSALLVPPPRAPEGTA